jgi:hypothetical protein
MSSSSSDKFAWVEDLYISYTDALFYTNGTTVMMTLLVVLTIALFYTTFRTRDTPIEEKKSDTDNVLAMMKKSKSTLF